MKTLLWIGLPFRRRAVACLLLVAGCAPGANLPPVPPYQPGIYRLGVGDQVRIITYGDDQLTDDFRVSDNGTLALPLLGAVPAEGKTTDDLAHLIVKDLQDHNLIKNASVSVEVTAYRPIAVLGEVAKPGEYPYHPGMTMLTAVAAAGGFTYRALQSYAEVVRQTRGHVVEGKLTVDGYVAPGDTIRVYERLF